MYASYLQANTIIQTDQYPLLVAQMEGHNGHEHIVEVSRTEYPSSSSSLDDELSMTNPLQHENRPLSSSEVSYTFFSPDRLDPGNFSFSRRGDGYSRHNRSLLDSGLWISVELIITLGQIIASVIVLSLSRDENPKTPLFEWVVGYACGCVASLPVLYWRFRNRNRGIEQDTLQTHEASSDPPEPVPYVAISASQASEENRRTLGTTRSYNQLRRSLIIRLDGLVDRFKMALDCFFAVWFVVGNIWIFGGHSSPSDAPRLYRLCIVFLTFSCIGYAMPFILCATICCCFPCIISFLGFREDLSRTRGATPESINALPKYKFKLQNHVKDHDHEATSEGGILAAGTEKERAIPEDDAVCCICLTRYADGDELRELPCFHVFHVECVDKWLQINALCPLCKSEIGESSGIDPDL